MFKTKIFASVGSDKELELSERISKSYESLTVVGRGTVSISMEDVHKDLVDSKAFTKAKKLIELKRINL